MSEQTNSKSAFLGELWPVLLSSLVLWALIPSLYFGNLHTDTLEAAYWGRDLAWGYSKHPPLVSWLLNIVLKPGSAPILTLLVLGQALAILSAWYVYDLVRIIAGRQTAVLAACMMMLTSVATFYAAQVNHNTVLVPFCAAVMNYGYRFMDRRRLIDAVSLGLATGLGMITKYEIIFALIPLLVLSLVKPRFRNIFLSTKTWLAVLISIAVLLPHLQWLASHDWTSLSRAVGSAPMNGGLTALFSIWGLFIGFVAVIAFPIMFLFLLRGRKPLQITPNDQPDEARTLGLIFLFTPLIAVGLASLVTDQYIKALWLLPLTPSAITGLALLIRRMPSDNMTTDRSAVALTVKLSAVIFILFQGYLLTSDAIDQPVESYLADTRPVSDAAEALWSKHSSEKLSCIISDEGKLSISPVLWIASRPQILPLSTEWMTNERQSTCAATGGLAVKFVLDGRFPVEEKFPHACLSDAVHMHINSVFGLGKTGWDAEVIYVAPKSHPNCSP
ncbi:MAG: glycosyltransferase family 39 protein [Beijerinckiaceae bacterium]|nr:glycosyltransferase family 39 protein [Beijerinckiaceae bacterium]